MSSAGDILSFRDTVELVKDFLETALHLVLFIREIYPHDMFEERQKYSVKVWRSRNPKLNEYIGRIIATVGEELGKGTLKKVALVVKEAQLEQTPLERFVFDVDWLVPKNQLPQNGLDYTPKKGGLPKDHVEDHFRGFLLKLLVADSYLLRLPKDVTFTVVIELADGAERPDSKAVSMGQAPVEWVPAERRDAPSGAAPLPQMMDVDGDESGDEPVSQPQDDNVTIAPLKTTRFGMINVQMVVEEMGAKFGGEHIDASAEEEARIRRDRKGKGKAV